MLSIEEFDQIICSIKEKDLELGKICNALGDCDKLYQISLLDETIRLLGHIFNDDGEWISYWMWELNYGEKWYKGCVTEADGTDVKLQTSADLYRLLIDNIAQREGKE